jgi:hypothetical protein
VDEAAAAAAPVEPEATAAPEETGTADTAAG